MKHTNESLSKMNKTEVIEHALALQNAHPDNFRNIAAIPAQDAKDENGITVAPAKEAVAAKSILAQLQSLPAYIAYSKACTEIDAKNEVARKEFESDPEVAEILNAKKHAAEFQESFGETLKQINELNNEADTITASMKKIGANLPALKKKRNEVEAKSEALTATLVIPNDFDLSESELPEFVPTQYPDIDTFFADGISGNFPASFIFGNKKVVGATKAKAVQGATKTWEADAFEKEVLRLHAAGKRNTEIISETGTESNNKITSLLAKHGLTPNKKA